MTRAFAFVALMLAAFGFSSGTKEPTAERRSSPGSEPPVVVRDRAAVPVETPWVRKNARPIPLPPAQTPLVEKLLPEEEPQLVDGQLSPRGEWRWSEADWKWQPVKKAVVKQPGPMWNQDGHGATVEHLTGTHGYSRAELEGLSQRELDILHSNSHNAARAAAPVRSSGCPGGNCPSPSYSRGLFGRRR